MCSSRSYGNLVPVFQVSRAFPGASAGRCPQGGLTWPVQCQPEELVGPIRTPVPQLVPWHTLGGVSLPPALSPVLGSSRPSLFSLPSAYSKPLAHKVENSGPGNLRRLLAAQPPGETRVNQKNSDPLPSPISITNWVTLYRKVKGGSREAGALSVATS